MHPKTLKPRTKTADEALSALMRLCARAERSEADARRLMRGWGVDEEDAQRILERLRRERFLDDGRYAAAFVREKLRLSGWGEYKIRAALGRKRIAQELVDAAWAEAGPQDMGQRLAQRLESKMRTVKYDSPRELKTKLIRYGLSLGYDYDAVLAAASQIAGQTDTCDDF